MGLLRTIGEWLGDAFRFIGGWLRQKWVGFSRTTQLALIVAAVIHLIALVIAAFQIVIPGRSEPPPLIAEVVQRPVVQNVERQRLSAVKQVRQARPSASAAISKMSLAKTDAAVRLPKSQVQHTPQTLGYGTGNLGLGQGFGQGLGMGGGAAGKFPAAIRGRCVPGQRAQLLQQNGGTPGVEVAVVKALDWLKANQNEDGTWGKSHQGAMTGLAVLCYLGHCETPKSRKYGDSVTKGIQALMLMRKENRKGLISDSAGSGSVYEHGIGTYALGEAYAMVGENTIPGLKEEFIRGVKVIIDGQNMSGGWVYYYLPDGDGDLSVTGWQVQALKAAKQMNMDIPGLPEAINRAGAFVTGRQGDLGGFGYKRRGDKHSLTGVGILCLQFLDFPSRQAGERAFNYWFAELPQFSYQDKSCDLYAAYYLNQAVFNYGGTFWNRWNAQMQPQLLSAQSPDGSWPVEGRALSEEQARRDADVYRTTLCCLMLEVYYRYLPVGGR
ncbi:MAG: terpene cyclase/mutase family protein [Verrucomicrobiales bacterium]|nr:terpene cyclase/mutase family protein [Verrucomicrobiales bacterium]